MRRAFFHEDDYCQRELLPVDNLAFCLRQNAAIAEHSAATFDGHGWKDVYVREERPPSPLVALQIPLESIRAALMQIAPAYDSVETGYGSSHREPCANTVAFGQDRRAALYVTFDDNSIVETMWCDEPQDWLLALPNAHQLLFVDWAWGFVCPLAEQGHFRAHLADREAHWRRFSQELEERRRHERRKRWWQFW
jgi:hypothetical protein